MFCRWENKDKDGLEIDKVNLINKYFSILDDDEILELYKIYENDFKMFGYNFNFRELSL